MTSADLIAASGGIVVYWLVWTAASVASRRLGPVEAHGAGAPGARGAAPVWKSGRNMAGAAVAGIGVTAMRHIAALALLPAIGFWAAVMVFPALYRYREGAGANARLVGTVRAVGQLAATVACVVVVYALAG
ncbi:MAG: hypothetical protein KGN74_07200 [Gemmatimonadota bacterium]|nr:hypothetical protein [Gemmatimonadota bacterium]